MLGLYVIFFTLFTTLTINFFLKKKNLLLDKKYSSHKSLVNNNEVPLSGGIIFLLSLLVFYKNEFYQFKKLLGITFDTIEDVSFSKNERQLVLQIIIRYFELHLDGFRKPKSLQILEAVFN